MKQHDKKRTHTPFYNAQVVASVSRGAGVGTWLVSWSPTKKSASMTRYSGASTRCRRMRSRNTRLARHKTLKGHTNTSSQIWKGAQGGRGDTRNSFQPEQSCKLRFYSNCCNFRVSCPSGHSFLQGSYRPPKLWTGHPDSRTQSCEHAHDCRGRRRRLLKSLGNEEAETPTFDR